MTKYTVTPRGEKFIVLDENNIGYGIYDAEFKAKRRIRDLIRKDTPIPAVKPVGKDVPAWNGPAEFSGLAANQLATAMIAPSIERSADIMANWANRQIERQRGVYPAVAKRHYRR